MKRLVYIYPEEWTGRRAREIHTLQTCLALAEAGTDVSLVTAGGFLPAKVMAALGRNQAPETFHSHNLSRRIGPVKSARIFFRNFKRWLQHHPRFDAAYVIHLKAAPLPLEANIPYIWEAHEIFAETPKPGTRRHKNIADAEAAALSRAAAIVCTSHALARAIGTRYFKDQPPVPVTVVPHGTESPMPHSLADSAGPFVYAGSLQDWKGLELAVAAAEKLDLPLRIIGGTKKEIAAAARRMQRVTRLRLSPLRRTHVVRHIEWRERVAPDQLPEHLLGCRAGLNPTLPHSASGHYSLPMKLYDYARCGLPAISSALDSLQGLGVESWCQVVEKPTVDSWSLALMQPIGVEQGRAALKWAAQNSWRKRAQALDAIISGL